MDATWLKRLSVASRDFPLSICPNIACPAMHSFISWLPLSLTNSTPSNPITPSFLIAHRLARRGKTRYWGYLAAVLKQYPQYFQGVCRVDPLDPAAPDHLSRLSEEQGFRGVRLSPAADASGDWIGGPLMPPL